MIRQANTNSYSYKFYNTIVLLIILCIGISIKIVGGKEINIEDSTTPIDRSSVQSLLYDEEIQNDIPKYYKNKWTLQYVKQVWNENLGWVWKEPSPTYHPTRSDCSVIYTQNKHDRMNPNSISFFTTSNDVYEIRITNRCNCDNRDYPATQAAAVAYEVAWKVSFMTGIDYEKFVRMYYHTFIKHITENKDIDKFSMWKSKEITINDFRISIEFIGQGTQFTSQIFIIK